MSNEQPNFYKCAHCGFRKTAWEMAASLLAKYCPRCKKDRKWWPVYVPVQKTP